MQRRTLFTGAGLGAAALAGGAWLAWRLGAGNAPEDGSGALWQQQFEQPDGAKLVLQSLRGRPTVVNFWATWCAPCVREMPQLQRFHEQQGAKGWQVVGLAIDNLAPVKSFLGERPVTFPIGLAGFAGLELVRALGNTNGALPYTVLLGRDGRVVWRKLGETNFEELVRETGQVA